MSEKLLYANGIHGASGDYLLLPRRPEDIAAIALSSGADRGSAHWHTLQARARSKTLAHFGSPSPLDYQDLAQVGWGVLFAQADQETALAVREALSALLEYRKKQAGSFYREFSGPDGYRADESGHEFLARHGIGLGTFDPSRRMPYYLLIVGDPETIPYEVQYHLGVQFAVGRIAFETLDEYASYAKSVVVVESGKLTLPPQAAFFGVRNPDDKATILSANKLVIPLAEHITLGQAQWEVASVVKEEATRSRLSCLMGGDETPAILFAASHSVGFSPGHPNQLLHQGALLCQDWPGTRRWGGAIPQDFFFGADDLDSSARLLGTMMFLFSSFSLGTPVRDVFSSPGPGQAPAQPDGLAPRAFLARLPQRLLAHPNGGALAVVGHMGRVWGYSLLLGSKDPTRLTQVQVFESMLRGVMNGDRLGGAFEYLRLNYATLAMDLSHDTDEYEMEAQWLDEHEKQSRMLRLAGLWTATHDARSYAILGDPAVRLSLNTTPGQARRPTLKTLTLPLALKARLVDRLSGRAPKTLAATETEERDMSEELTTTAEEAKQVKQVKQDGAPQHASATAGGWVAQGANEAPARRVINVWIDGLAENAPLRLGRTSELRLNVRLSPADVGVPAGGEEPPNLDPHLNPDFDLPDAPEFAEILVLLETSDVTVYGEPQQTLVVPRAAGPSKNTLTFCIEPKRPGPATITALCLANGRPCQNITITLPVAEGTEGEEKQEGQPVEEREARPPERVRTTVSGLTLDSGIARSLHQERWETEQGRHHLSLMMVKQEGGYQCILRNGGVMRAFLNLSETRLAALLARARDDLRYVVSSRLDGNCVYLLEDTTIPAEVYAASLKTLAKLGFYLYQQLFYAPGNGPDAHAIGTLLRRISQHHRLNIEIVAGQLTFPWALLYDRATLDTDRVETEGFWGFKHLIQVLPEFSGPTPVNFAPDIVVGDSLRVGLVFDEAIDHHVGQPVLQKQRAGLRALPNVTVSEHTTRQDLFTLLSNADAPEQVLYFLCRATSHLPAEPGGQNGQNEQNGSTSPALALSDGKISLDDLAAHAPPHRPPLKQAPLVFLNPCQSATLTPYLYGELVPYLLSRGVRGVVGPEGDPPSLFAAEFAQAFLQRFTDGEQTSGEILLQLRQDYLKKHNVLGLLYALYASGSIVVRRQAAAAEARAPEEPSPEGIPEVGLSFGVGRPAPEPAPEPVSMDEGPTTLGPGVSFGWFDFLGGEASEEAPPGQLEQTRVSLGQAVQEFAHRLGETLKQVMSDVSTLEVSTYVSDNVSTQREEALLRAFTRIMFNGDIETYVPSDGDDMDETLWQMHLDMVERAQEHRTELLKTLAEAATGLIDVFK
ncbi:MAG: CHAT domain-containing protein [Chloroflexaceae bacterium]|nr:CHAT domain-containing protein [Chloroflexaceae bacterium]